MILQHLLAKRHVDFQMRTAFLHEVRFSAVVHVLPVHLELTVLPQIAPCADTYAISQSAEPSLLQHNKGRNKRGHYITAQIPNCADKAHHPFRVIDKIVSAYFSQ